MNIVELRQKPTSDLQKQLADKRTELVEKQRSLHAGELTNPKSIKETRREIAVLLTVINQQQARMAKEQA